MNESKRNVLGVLVDAVDYDVAVARILSSAKAKEPLAVSALAVHGVMTGALHSEHRYRLNHLDLVVPDGQPVRWALNWLHGARLSDRVYGPTLMLKICAQAAAEELPIFLYGSSDKVLASLRSGLRERFPGLVVAGVAPSRFRRISQEEKAQVIRDVTESGAAMVFVGLGCPRQEVWIYEYREALSMPLIAVGAAFDFHAGLLPQAPQRLQNAGLEWLYRLTKEPGRLWKRYVLLNPSYLVLLFLQLLHLKRFDPGSATPPSEEARFG